jgi:hypothetical protein
MRKAGVQADGWSSVPRAFDVHEPADIPDVVHDPAGRPHVGLELAAAAWHKIQALTLTTRAVQDADAWTVDGIDGNTDDRPALPVGQVDPEKVLEITRVAGVEPELPIADPERGCSGVRVPGAGELGNGCLDARQGQQRQQEPRGPRPCDGGATPDHRGEYSPHSRSPCSTEENAAEGACQPGIVNGPQRTRCFLRCCGSLCAAPAARTAS